MGRLRKRLIDFQRGMVQNQYNYDDFPPGFVPEEEPYVEEEVVTRSALATQYDKLQRRTSKFYDEEMKVMEATNPHSLYKEIMNKPTEKKAYRMRLFGRPVDLASLEHYLIFPISPKTVTTLMRYNDARAIEEIKGYSKRPAKAFKSGLIWIIIGAVAILILGMVLFTQGPNLTEMMKGLFGQ